MDNLFDGFVFLVQCLYLIPVVILNTLELYVLVFKKNLTFKSKFFKLERIKIIINFITIANTFLIMKLPRCSGRDGIMSSVYDWLDDTLINRVFIMFSYFLAYNQYFLLLVIACERLSSTLDSTSRLRCLGKLLTFPRLPTFISLIFLPIPFTYKQLLYPARSQFNEITQRREIIGTLSLDESFHILNPFMLVTSTMSLIMSVGNLICFRFDVKLIKKKYVQSHIVIATVLEAFFQFCGVILSIQRVQNEINGNGNDYTFWLPFVSDGLSMTPAVLLFVFSNVVNQEIVGIFVKRRTSVMESSIWIQRRITVSQRI